MTHPRMLNFQSTLIVKSIVILMTCTIQTLNKVASMTLLHHQLKPPLLTYIPPHDLPAIEASPIHHRVECYPCCPYSSCCSFGGSWTYVTQATSISFVRC